MLKIAISLAYGIPNLQAFSMCWVVRLKEPAKFECNGELGIMHAAVLYDLLPIEAVGCGLAMHMHTHSGSPPLCSAFIECVIIPV